MLRLSILMSLALVIVTSAAWAAAGAAGCPPGSKRHCVQTKSGIQCYCR
jgi:hypothetical protein